MAIPHTTVDAADFSTSIIQPQFKPVYPGRQFNRLEIFACILQQSFHEIADCGHFANGTPFFSSYHLLVII